MRSKTQEARRHAGTKARSASGTAVDSAALRASLLLILALSGCQTARVERPLTQELGGNDPGQQLEFWDRLAEQPVTSNDDAFHGLLMYLDGDDPADDYPGRVRALKSRKMLPAGFSQPAQQAVDRGTIAVAILKALNIRGGLALQVLGPNPRYAVRELVFMELYPPSSPNQTFSGAEFLGIIGKLEDHQRAQGMTPGVARDTGLQVAPEPRPGVQPAPPDQTQTGPGPG